MNLYKNYLYYLYYFGLFSLILSESSRKDVLSNSSLDLFCNSLARYLEDILGFGLMASLVIVLLSESLFTLATIALALAYPGPANFCIFIVRFLNFILDS